MADDNHDDTTRQNESETQSSTQNPNTPKTNFELLTAATSHIKSLSRPALNTISDLLMNFSKNLELKKVTMMGLKNLWQHSVAKTTLLFYIIGYSIIYWFGGVFWERFFNRK